MPPDPANRVGETLKKFLRHVPAVLGTVLLIGAIYVVQKEFRNLKIADIAARCTRCPRPR